MQEDPTANLTFNLRLSEQEKAARDAVVLPYMHHLQGMPIRCNGSLISIESKPAVTSVLDDDYDEEDPDDDLDI